MLILMEYPRKILHISPPPHKFCPSDNVNHKDKKQSWKYVSQKKDDGTLYEPFMNLRHLIDFRHRRQKVLISWNFAGLKVDRFASVWMRWSYLMKRTASLFGVIGSIDKILCGTINASQMYPTAAANVQERTYRVNKVSLWFKVGIRNFWVYSAQKYHHHYLLYF